MCLFLIYILVTTLGALQHSLTLQVYTSPSELQLAGLRVLAASAVVVAAAVAVSAHVTTELGKRSRGRRYP